MKGFPYLKRATIVFFCLIAVVAITSIVTSSKESDEASIAVISERMLIPGGQSVGVRMDVKGVLVVGLEEIQTENLEYVNPGLLAGLEIGDTIIEIDGTKVLRAKEVQKIVNTSSGTVKLKVQRKERIINLEIKPVISREDGQYKLGVWVKDKTAGIGTLTFYDPLTKQFGALGHGITDPETGTVLTVAEGELLNSKVESVKGGKVGSPGEIRGIFYEAEAPLGELKKNSPYGIFGTSYTEITNQLYEKPLIIAKKEQVKVGPAYILTTISGDKIQKFEIEIEKINKQTTQDTKSMIIRVTDESLLQSTGGIVQGMSGSPIIQGNRIVGAVTHVFVNNPEKGYGVFIEWMLKECGIS